jgi:hypothetical protein
MPGSLTIRCRTGPARHRDRLGGSSLDPQQPIASADFRVPPDGPRNATLAQIDPRTDTSHQNAKNGRGMWPQCGVTRPPHMFPAERVFPAYRDPAVAAIEPAKASPDREQGGLKRRFCGCRSGIKFGIRPALSVDRPPAARLYKTHTARRPPLGAMSRLRSTSLIFGDPSFRSRSEAWSFDGSPAFAGEWDRSKSRAV